MAHTPRLKLFEDAAKACGYQIRVVRISEDRIVGCGARQMRQFRRLPLPGNRAHRLVQVLFRLMLEEQIGLHDVADRVGTSASTIGSWRRGAAPRLDLLEAAFNVIGYEMHLAAVAAAAGSEQQAAAPLQEAA